LTISAVLYNSVRWLPDFFSALLLSHYPLDRLSLIFVDNSSTDETPQHVRDWIKANSSKFRSAKLFVRPNDGYGAGNDFAIRQASTDFVLVTNVDGEFTRDLLRILAATAVSDSKKVASWEARQAPFEHPKYYDPVTLLTNWSSHACVLIRKAAYEASGGYEKRLFMYGEDVELSYRLRSKDYLLRYVPSAKFIHHTDIDVRGPRDLQLSGSLAANILLRHRYGKLVDALAGEALLRYLNSTERDTTRKIAIRAALRSVARHRRSFRDSRYRIFRMGRRRGFSFFPFSGFDYDITRDGAAHRSRLDLFSSDLPKVSIITRTIGERQWLLREAIASVLNQTYPNIEHIIVEDKGKESVGLVDSIRKKYGADIRFISSPTGGRSAAGNAGLKAATGEYILFLDDDDLLFPDHVETLVEALINSPEYMCAYSLAWMVPTEIASKLRSYHEIGHLMVHDHRRPFNRHRLHVENIAAIQSVIFRRRAYEYVADFM
jgi:GT2 family glycosyltransferase